MRFCAYGVERCADFIDIGDVDMETIEDEILRLKEERNAVILAHVYQPDEIQEIADFTGDSFKLSVEASKTDADVIVFCGVRFMAETANILSPDKITLLPAEDAGCQMFDDTLLPRVKAELANAWYGLGWCWDRLGGLQQAAEFYEGYLSRADRKSYDYRILASQKRLREIRHQESSRHSSHHVIHGRGWNGHS